MVRDRWSPTPKMDANEVRSFLAHYNRLRNLDRLKECEYAHFDCSVRDRGPCLDEVLGRAAVLGLSPR